MAASRPQVVGSRVDELTSGNAPVSIAWADLYPLVTAFWALVQARGDLAERHRPGRLKQWLNQLRRCHPQAEALYGELRAISEPKRITEHLAESARVFNAFAGSRQSPIPGCRQAA